jgi:diguanylate cyclase (GGDEF)-like protein
MAGALAGQTEISEVGDVVARHLRRLVPFSLLVLYLYDSDTNDLEARHAVGESAPVVGGLRVSLGQRLSGWVAVNRQTIMNSDPILDLGELARTLQPRLRNCISSPLLSGETLVGVLTLYSAGPENFNEDHRRAVEAVSRQVADAFKRTVEYNPAVGRDLLTGLPSIDQLAHLTRLGEEDAVLQAPMLTLLMMDVLDLSRVNLVHGRAAGDEALRHAAKVIGADIHLPDMVFRCGGSKFLALLHTGDSQVADVIGRRIASAVSARQLVLGSGARIAVQLSVRCVSAPRDGGSLHALLEAARVSLSHRPSIPEPSSVH